MRLLKSLFLITIILSKVIYSAFWQFNFYMNQKEIVAIECENKNRPELSCNGKCYLAKQLAKADNELEQKKSEQKNRISVLKSLETEIFYFQAPCFCLSLSSEILEKQLFWNKSNEPTQSYIPSIDHPPC
jgi:hypothetical protein